MGTFILFCKSFRDDVLRVKRLLDSVIAYNVDFIPFYLSVPQRDVNLFLEYIDFQTLKSSYQGKIELITDESIVAQRRPTQLTTYHATKGYISQQVIKAIAWEKLPCEAYLALDSDAYFTKSFYQRDFFFRVDTPFTIMHDGSELMDLSEKLGHHNVKTLFLKDSSLVKEEFGRVGADYDFGPAPLIWSVKVWQDLEKHLHDHQETIWEAFTRIPSEIRWYGETLLKYQSIELRPIQPIFHCYQYAWQAAYYKKHPELMTRTNWIIGEVVQSYWDESLRPNFAKKSWASRHWKNIKAAIKR